MPSPGAAPVAVCLVGMPISRPSGPSLALGLLQAILGQAGVATTTLYANLAFSRHISLREESWLSACSRDQSLGDWIFAGAAFPDFAPDHDQYLALAHARNPVYARESLATFQERAWSLRQRAETFVAETTQRVLDLRPRILGCSSTCVQQVASLALLRQVREQDPGLVTMLGGANCEGVMGLATHRAFPWVDYVVSGEADDLIVDLVRGALERGRALAPADLPPGVMGPCHRGAGYPGPEDDPPRAVCRDLASLPLPDYGDYFRELAGIPLLKEIIQPGLLVESSRGCWWGQCHFCSLDGRKCRFRSKPGRRVLAELEALTARHGVNRFLFTDSLMNRGYLRTLLPELQRRGAPYRLFIEIKSNLVRNELEALKRAGFTFLQPGIESFSSAHLAHMNKGVAAWQNVMVVKLCRELGLGCVYNLLHDLPGEREEWLQEMTRLVPWLTHLRPPGSVCQVRFDRLSHYAEHQAQWGLELSASRAFTAIYPLPPEQINRLVYSFVDREREEVADSPFLSLALRRQAVLDLLTQVRQWRAAYYAPTPARLSWRREGQTVIVTDTRPASTRPDCVLEAMARDLFLACADAPVAEDLRARFLARGAAAQEWDAALAQLSQAGYLVELDGRLVGLALSEPVPPEACFADFGGGSVDTQRLAQLRRATSAARDEAADA